MKSLLVFENEPKEYIERRFYDLGHSLVNYLPLQWEHIPEGVQEHGVQIEFHPTEPKGEKTSDEIIEHIKEKLSSLKDSQWKMVSLHEESFKILLCEFYDLCKDNRHYYTETNYIHVMEINGFHLPKYSYRAFDNFKKTEASTTNFLPSNLYNVRDLLFDIKDAPYMFAREYYCENDIEYFLAVALELVRQGHLVKQCEHCGRWFITENKTDEKYCKRASPQYPDKTCVQAMRTIKERQRIKSNPLNVAKKAARSRANSMENHNHFGSVESCKEMIREWDNRFKSGEITLNEYISHLDRSFRRKGQ